LNIRLLFFFLLLLTLSAPAPASALAQGGSGHTRAFDSPTLRLQNKAESLYRNGHWERAYFIYVNELAAAGDKYAQYMAGYMCLNGKGVPHNPIAASAWYRLAAERGGQEFVAVRDELLESMSDDDREESDNTFLRLRQKYSDLVLALEHLERERHQLLDRPTGSRLSGKSASITVIDPRTGLTMTRSEYVDRLESRMQRRLDYITAKLDVERVEADMSDSEFAALNTQITDFLSVVNDR